MADPSTQFQDPLSSEDYAKLACHGIKLMLNNDFVGADRLFRQHKDNSVHMAVGYCYLTFLNAVMSFEEDQIQQCRECLKETERKYSHLSSHPTTPCTPTPSTPADTSWYSSVKNLIIGTSDKQLEDPVWQLERHVVLADCQVLLALLNFLQQELGSMMRGGWVLRRAWKMYDTTYARLVTMCSDAAGTQHQQHDPDDAMPQSLSPYLYPFDSSTQACSGPTSPSSPSAFPCSTLNSPNMSRFPSYPPYSLSAASVTPHSSTSPIPTPDTSVCSPLHASVSANIINNNVNNIRWQADVTSDCLDGNHESSISSEDQVVASDPSIVANSSTSFVNTSRPTTLNYFSSALFPSAKAAENCNSSVALSPNALVHSPAQSPFSPSSSPRSPVHLPVNSSPNTLSPSPSPITPTAAPRQSGRFSRLRPHTLKVSMSKSVPNIRGFFSHKHTNNNVKSGGAPSPSAEVSSPSSPRHASRPPSTSPYPSSLVARVLGAASFGYGGLQLLGSLLPPSLLKLVQVFGGLPGDRGKALQALMRTRSSQDMRAPLATLSLLWYHTIVRPFLGVEGGGGRGERRRATAGAGAGVEAARLLLQEMLPLYPHSALFLFFTARVHRLKGELTSAVEQYSAAMTLSSHRELRLLSLHELGWCRLACLDFTRAAQAFASLRKHSRWCNTFYAYVAAMCTGASGGVSECVALLEEVPQLSRNSNVVLEAFLLRRAAKSRDLDAATCRLRCYELLYLWNVLASCSTDSLGHIHTDCDSMRLPPEQTALAKLLAGVALDYLDRPQEALMLLQEAVTVWRAPRPPASALAATSASSAAMNASSPASADAEHRLEADGASAAADSASSAADVAQVEMDVDGTADRTGNSLEAEWDTEEGEKDGTNSKSSTKDDSRSDSAVAVQANHWDEENIPAFACYEIGFILSRISENGRESKSWLLEARDKYSGYDFESRLSVKIHQALKSIPQ